MWNADTRPLSFPTSGKESRSQAGSNTRTQGFPVLSESSWDRKLWSGRWSIRWSLEYFGWSAVGGGVWSPQLMHHCCFHINFVTYNEMFVMFCDIQCNVGHFQCLVMWDPRLHLASENNHILTKIQRFIVSWILWIYPCEKNCQPGVKFWPKHKILPNQTVCVQDISVQNIWQIFYSSPTFSRCRWHPSRLDIFSIV